MTASKVVLITGTSSGIGRITAESLARAGHTVFASMRNIAGKNAANAAALRTLAETEKLDLHVIELDVTNVDSINAAVQQVIDTAGQIDVLINNAGYGIFGVVESFTQEQMHKLFTTNVYGPINVTNAVLPHMRRQQSGLLIHIGSTSGHVPYPCWSVYAGTKAAFENIALGINNEVYSLGIDTVIIQAGGYETGFGGNMEIGAREEVLEGYGAVGQIAKAMSQGLEAQFTSGWMSDPATLANKIAEVIEMPAGERPLKLAIGMGSEGFEALNSVALPLQRGLLEAFGFAPFITRQVAEPV